MSVADRLPFPETPFQMYLMLRVEDAVKREGCFTHDGMNGYVIFEFLKEEGGEDRGTIARGVFLPHWDAARDRSLDDVGIPIQ